MPKAKPTIILNNKAGKPFVTKVGKKYFIETTEYTDDVNLLLDAVANVKETPYNDMFSRDLKTKDAYWKVHFNYQWSGGGLVLWHNPTDMWNQELARRGELMCPTCGNRMVMHYTVKCVVCNKPKAKKKQLHDYHEMVKFIEVKYKIDIRDYGCVKYATTAKEHKSSSSFNVYHQIGWENANYPRLAQFRKNPLPGFGLDQEGMDFYKTQEGNKFFDDIRRAYEKAPDGKCKEIPYMDFWHFMLDDYFGGDINNGCTRSINWQDVVDIAKEDWQKEIAELFLKEFGKKDLNVDISW